MPPRAKKPPAKQPAKRRTVRKKKTAPTPDNLVPEIPNGEEAKRIDFADAVLQAARDGVALETVAIMVGLKLKDMRKKEREEFDELYARGLAIGVSDVMSGVTRAARGGDTKAAQMFMDIVGVKPHQDKTGGAGSGQKRLFVEVTQLDA